MNLIKKITAAFILSFFTLAVGITTRVLASSPPTCSITTNQDSSNRYLFRTSISWSGALNIWHQFHWGDEKQTTEPAVGFFGSSGSANWEHIYNPGTWQQWTNISGPGGMAKCLLTIKLELQNDPATCSISTIQDSSNPQVYHTTIGWDRAYDGWHTFYWGDEGVTGNSPVGFYGKYGSVSFDHFYNHGTWDQWTNVHGPGGVAQCKQVVTVESQTYQKPSCSVSTNPVSGNPLRYQTTFSWQNASNAWHTFYWGDEAQTGSGPVGYYGSSGTISWEHEYSPGSWQQWSNLYGPAGWGGCLVTITANN